LVSFLRFIVVMSGKIIIIVLLVILVIGIGVGGYFYFKQSSSVSPTPTPKPQETPEQTKSNNSTVSMTTQLGELSKQLSALSKSPN
jgi:flagellar basal body-associated protein FliL